MWRRKGERIIDLHGVVINAISDSYPLREKRRSKLIKVIFIPATAGVITVAKVARFRVSSPARFRMSLDYFTIRAE